jgi:succinate dehydrogenase/fumarate reductase flavoprotein subunit
MAFLMNGYQIAGLSYLTYCSHLGLTRSSSTSISGKISKSNWAQSIDTPPFRAYPVTGGITFTYGGVKVSQEAAVLNDKSSKIEVLFACGEMVGGVHRQSQTPLKTLH